MLHIPSLSLSSRHLLKQASNPLFCACRTGSRDRPILAQPVEPNNQPSEVDELRAELAEVEDMQRSMAELLTLMDCDVTGSDSPSGDFVGDASSLECEHLERVERDVETQIEIQNEQKESKEPAQCLGWRPRSEESPNDSVEVNDVYNLQLREEAECEEEGLRPEQEPEAPSISEDRASHH